MDHKMMVRADARALGAITALGAPMRSKPRTTDCRTGSRAGECVSYFLDADGNVVNAKVFTASRTRKPNRRRTVIVADRRTTDIALMQKMGTIHNGDM